MKKIFFGLGMMLMCSGNIFSQAFTQKWSIPLRSSYETAKPEWADLDNDGLLDIVLLIHDSNDESFISVIKGDTVSSPVDDTLKFPVASSERFYLVDFNADNMIDIIVPGPDASVSPIVWINGGNWNFTSHQENIPSFTKMLFTDLDNDVFPEWIVHYESGGTNFVTTFKKIGSQWTPVDTLLIKAESIEILDADGDGFRDLFVSGQVNADSLFTGVLINQGKFNYNITNRSEWKGTGSIGDLNHDGLFDIIFKGVDASGSPVNKVYLSNDTALIARDSACNAITRSFFIADFNSDGLADVNFWSKDASGDSISLIRRGSSQYDTIRLNKVIAEKFGDFDHDGDLDVLHVRNETPLSIVLLANNAPANAAPGPAKEVNAFLFFDHIFMSWKSADDDHTNPAALTYDLYIDGTNPGDFDLINEQRLKVNHGNNGSNTFILAAKPETPGLQFALQTVDNSLHAGGGICMGSIQGCATMALDSVKMCSKQQRVFNAPQNSDWFSFSSGYLSSGTRLTYTATTSDVIFYFNPATPDCAHLSAWYIEVKDTTRFESSAVFACEGSEVQLDAGDGWTTVKWSSIDRGDLGTAQAIQYLVQGHDKVTSFLSMGTGCKVNVEYDINISKPVIAITSENNFVLAGNSTQLHASGAEEYLWTPAGTISNVTSSDPMVSPLETTDYVVTGHDSIGCTNQATIRIGVEKNGYIPSLFTPNSDGQNDYLRVYGVFDVSEISFEIFNRNGNSVFSASSLSELNQGWDGTAHGVKQPGGVYFWKVNGKLLSGDKIQFNGKEAGSIVLIR